MASRKSHRGRKASLLNGAILWPLAIRRLKYWLALDKPYRKNPPLEQWEHGVLIRTCTPSVGMVIGTYGTPAYIALQIAARNRWYPHVPLLVHDDGSPDAERLAALCKASGVDFVGRSQRSGWSLGDMAAVVAGLDWGRQKGLDIVIKVSRRYVLCHDWVPGLQQLAYGTQAATYGNACGFFGIRFRPECMATHVGAWHAAGAVEEMRGRVARGRRVAKWIEEWYQSLVLHVHLSQAPRTVRRWEHLFPRDAHWRGYALWPMMGMSRKSRMPGVLWHDINSCDEYRALARELGLEDFAISDFELPTGAENVRDEEIVLAASASGRQE
ncbi:MAG: hypothetical protein ACLQVD_16875 [Capsulimonadaceae bacterium]